ncbi:hypothetical protein EYF80_063334 [Liparis tanakae]|uniref:Uncharacterized protein n=1 Tax=Liparis tanakae TaxID=230148 RepID=A0A4Z2ECN7_9TELE|nr:hypothetical protein EYF80_063334 [Liparis tanakae]
MTVIRGMTSLLGPFITRVGPATDDVDALRRHGAPLGGAPRQHSAPLGDALLRHSAPLHDADGAHRPGLIAAESGVNTTTSDATGGRQTDSGRGIHRRGAEIVDIRNFRGAMNPPPDQTTTGQPRASSAVLQMTPQMTRPRFIPPPESQLRVSMHTVSTSAVVHGQQREDDVPDLQDPEQESDAEDEEMEESLLTPESSPSHSPTEPTRLRNPVIQTTPIRFPRDNVSTPPPPPLSPVVPPTHTPLPQRVTRSNKCAQTLSSRIMGVSQGELTSWLEEARPKGTRKDPLLSINEFSRAPKKVGFHGERIQSNVHSSVLMPHLSPTNTGPFLPRRHENNIGQPRDLHLDVTRQWLIIGDSNISRLPAHKVQNLQLDSFPGATFQQAGDILQKIQTTQGVSKVILSFGFNDRTQKSSEGPTEQLLGMLSTARQKFPKAEIFIPQVNFSRALPTREKLRLTQLNTFIISIDEGLPMLDESEFVTATDNLHWSSNTAAKIMDHWIRHLN